MYKITDSHKDTPFKTLTLHYRHNKFCTKKNSENIVEHDFWLFWRKAWLTLESDCCSIKTTSYWHHVRRSDVRLMSIWCCFDVDPEGPFLDVVMVYCSKIASFTTKLVWVKKNMGPSTGPYGTIPQRTYALSYISYVFYCSYVL